MTTEPINPAHFDFVSGKLREFCKTRSLTESYLQNLLSILSACEDPKTVTSFEYAGQVWPQRQTNQMSLEDLIMTRPTESGYFCFTTSYRQEPHPIPGRHDLIFPMFEFEIPAGFKELIEFEKDMLEFLGFGPKEKYAEINYLDACARYGVAELTHEHEAMLCRDLGPVVFLKYFPETTSPFFNMKRDPDTGLACKVDVIVHGIETFGSAERSCDPDRMREAFYKISGGQYAQTLFARFGKDRVERELETFLRHRFIRRSGCGIGLTRLIRGCRLQGILPA
jgi:aspartyl/asparaginyl-tRNA synthetase